MDQTLTVDSDAWLDIREDKLRLTWSLSLKFRRGLREFFSIELPTGYLVEKVTGTNVRGWEVKRADGKQKLEIALLKPAKEHEEFEVCLWRGGAVTGAEAAILEVPVVGVTGAIRHTGRVTIRQ